MSAQAWWPAHQHGQDRLLASGRRPFQTTPVSGQAPSSRTLTPTLCQASHGELGDLATPGRGMPQLQTSRWESRAHDHATWNYRPRHPQLVPRAQRHAQHLPDHRPASPLTGLPPSGPTPCTAHSKLPLHPSPSLHPPHEAPRPRSCRPLCTAAQIEERAQPSGQGLPGENATAAQQTKRGTPWTRLPHPLPTADDGVLTVSALAHQLLQGPPRKELRRTPMEPEMAPRPWTRKMAAQTQDGVLLVRSVRAEVAQQGNGRRRTRIQTQEHWEVVGGVNQTRNLDWTGGGIQRRVLQVQVAVQVETLLKRRTSCLHSLASRHARERRRSQSRIRRLGMGMVVVAAAVHQKRRTGPRAAEPAERGERGERAASLGGQIRS
mmetsp:Transcript_28705/g.93253  ORF Transcript_28705/g.93253 Transcript_28705/m.93253 type:complete len:378 (-) Transcript_28705:1697-2830(-)